MTAAGLPRTQFHVMTKPIGPVCNLDCTYCYYLSKKNFFGEDNHWRMPDALVERYIRQYIAAQDVGEVNFSWQGGEPTLLGLDFFAKVVQWQKTYCPPTKRIVNDLQTNGTLLDDEWCRFLKNNRFLVGLSVDGPEGLHDCYRRDRRGRGTFDRVVRAARLMQEHGVEFNTLTVVNRMNAQHPSEVYRFLRDELGSKYLQFIPCVEPKGFAAVAPRHWDRSLLPPLGAAAARPGAAESVVTDWTVDPEDYGDFLCTIFDEWLRRDVGEVFVPIFDMALGVWLGMPASACYFAETCGKALAVEHDGSVYACDHFVYPEYKLGNLKESSLLDLLYTDRQMRFGLDKTDTLTQYCRDCEVRFVCNGECPKNRFLYAPDGEFGLTYLCAGLRTFFSHIDPWMKLMANELRAGRTADGVMKIANGQHPAAAASARPRIQTKLNARCPCGSGRKYKKCCYAMDQERKGQSL
ncbi:MAG: anaerobic sulfatase maturase [Phycisphaerae bacterium]|nr:anaerobic sulfatase maturase [Phycisphaerae bacterium]